MYLFFYFIFLSRPGKFSPFSQRINFFSKTTSIFRKGLQIERTAAPICAFTIYMSFLGLSSSTDFENFRDILTQCFFLIFSKTAPTSLILRVQPKDHVMGVLPCTSVCVLNFEFLVVFVETYSHFSKTTKSD